MLGVIIGMAIANYDLVQTCLINLAQENSQIKTKAFIRGCVSLVTKNSTHENMLKPLFKELGVPAQLGMNLLRLVNHEINENVYSAALNI